jgi:hypothetical protein
MIGDDFPGLEIDVRYAAAFRWMRQDLAFADRPQILDGMDSGHENQQTTPRPLWPSYPIGPSATKLGPTKKGLSDFTVNAAGCYS